MTLKRLFLIGIFFLGMACNTITRALEVPTASLPPTLAPPPTAVPLTTVAPTPTRADGLYIPPGCENVPLATVDPTEVASHPLVVPTPTVEPNPTLSKDTQLAVFEDFAKTVSEVYLYPDFNGHDWKAITAKYRALVKGGLDTETFYTDMNAMITELGDDHSRFESPAEVKQSDADLAGVTDYVGIGVLVQPLIDKGYVTILTVSPDSPADHAGLKPHDNILSADDQPLIENGIYLPRVRGPECTAVVLSVQTPGQSARNMTVVRHRITAFNSVHAELAPTTDGSRIGYIFLPSFFDETIPGHVKEALQAFGDLDGLIIDNRLNGGGASTVVEPILSYLTKGTLGEFRSRTESRPLTIQPDPVNNSQTVPLVILVGKGTVSFGEIFSGALQDSGRAKVVGVLTDGNVETLYSYYFEDGSRAWIAHERFDPAVSHADWETTGIIPDVAVTDPGWDTVTLATDSTVAAAVKVLGHK